MAGSRARWCGWIGRGGRALGAPPGAYEHPRASPDGTRIVVGSRDQGEDLWRWDLPRGPLTRLTFEPGLDSWPVWTPDGRELVFTSPRAGSAYNLFWQMVDGHRRGRAAE